DARSGVRLRRVRSAGRLVRAARRSAGKPGRGVVWRTRDRPADRPADGEAWARRGAAAMRLREPPAGAGEWMGQRRFVIASEAKQSRETKAGLPRLFGARNDGDEAPAPPRPAGSDRRYLRHP